MVKEFNMMRAWGVYKLVKWPLGMNMIGTKWVYVLKFNGDGGLSDRKARIVAQGFFQIQGVDFEDTYAAMTRLESFYLLLAIVASTGLHLW